MTSRIARAAPRGTGEVGVDTIERLPRPRDLALFLPLALATAGWAATWGTRAGASFLVLNAGAALFALGAIVGWVVGR
jgi:hypothetical protein